MKPKKFSTTVELGHKGPALVFPFDPAELWGKRARHFVKGTLDGCAFEGEIGYRRRVHYTCLDEELMRAAKLAPGDPVEVTITPREPGEADLEADARMAWTRRAGKSPLGREKEVAQIERNGLPPWGGKRTPTKRPKR
jgi:hypothetical protein